MTQPEFEMFPKMPRLSREVVITEKIDGTNAQICITEDGNIYAGSRKRWITPESDNFGFAKWVEENKEDLLSLGEGRHFGEWWGSGIQRRYNQDRKRFSLFNVDRWGEDRPECCDVVPVLYRGIFDTTAAMNCLCVLEEEGSAASPGFMNPEGIIIYHIQGRFGLKKTLEKDEMPKTLAHENNKEATQ